MLICFGNFGEGNFDGALATDGAAKHYPETEIVREHRSARHRRRAAAGEPRRTAKCTVRSVNSHRPPLLALRLVWLFVSIAK